MVYPIPVPVRESAVKVKVPALSIVLRSTIANTFTEIGPRDSVAVILALDVSAVKAQLPVSGLGPELFPELLLFLHAEKISRKKTTDKRADLYSIVKDFIKQITKLRSI
jgi:hypothetical protein